MLRDRIQKHPYPRQNTATILNYLEELILINAKEVGLVPISQETNGYQDVFVPFGSVLQLSVPQGAVSATIMVEKGTNTNPPIQGESEGEASFAPPRVQNTNGITSASNSSAVIRFKENGSTPNLNSGFALAEHDIYELVGAQNLQRFQVTALQEKGAVLRIQFYQTAQ